MYKDRTLYTFFNKIKEQFPVLLITGPRQVGKTTFLQQQEKRPYVTLDDPLLRELAQNEPTLFLKRFPPPILIDEIQYAPNLFPYINMLCDQMRQPNLFWLTGSQQFQLM